MRFLKSLFVVSLVLICTGAFADVANSQATSVSQFELRVYQAIHNYWDVQDNFMNYIKDQTDENEAKWIESMDRHSKSSILIGKSVLKTLKVNEHSQVEMLSRIYKDLPVAARCSMFDILGYMKVESQQDASKYLNSKQFREYFPGYGYSDPGYKYRKGHEVDREYKGVTWQSEEQSISTTWNVHLTISIDLMKILTGWLSSGAIKNLKVGKQYNMDVGGQPMIVCDVSFQRIKAITTKTNRKFEINKVWFELLRAKSSVWSTGDWEKCGKTYEILQEPTGEMVVTGLE